MKTVWLVLFFLFLISCQTTQQAQDTASSEEEAVGDLVAEDSEEEDLESEFADSEDFEKEITKESFPSEEGPADEENKITQKESPAEDLVEDIDEEDEDFSEFAEDSTPPAKEEESAQTEEAMPVEDIAEADLEEEKDTTEEDSADLGGLVEVQNIRYSAEENKIYIDGTGAFSYQQRENKANNQFIIEIESAVLSEGLRERPFIMKDFNTDMALLMADQKDSATVRIVVQMRENASMPSSSVEEGGGLVISSSSEGGDLMIAGPVDSTDGFGNEEAGGGDVTGEVLPAKSLEDFFLKTPRFTGRPISIHFKEVDIKDVLYFISEGTGLNMVLDDDISGNISIKLRNVPWDQALITVMKTKKLGYVREGNVIRIMQLESLKKNQKDIQEMLESQKVLEPLKVKVIPIAYAKAGEIQKHAEIFLSKESRGPAGSGSASGGGGTARGKIVVDTQHNSLIVVDTEKSIKQIEAMVKSLDKSPTQVMIEAKVVEANENFVRDVGINWKYEGEALRLLENTGFALTLDGGLEMFPSDSAGGGTSNTNLNLLFAPLGTLDINLGLSEVEGSARVISAPRVMVLNGESATITQSSQSLSPKATTTDQGTTVAAERASANLEFKVTPQITSLGSIFMDIDVTRAFFGQRDAVTRARPTFTRSAKTKVLVNNGQTVVIGGIYQYEEQKGEAGFPILRHIPIINWLFTRWTSDKQKNELLVFLTPRALEWTAQKAVEIN